MSKLIILIIVIISISTFTFAFDCSQEIIDTINIVKKLQPICNPRDNQCIQENRRDIAKITGEMNFKCFMKAKTKANANTDYNECKKNNETNNKII